MIVDKTQAESWPKWRQSNLAVIQEVWDYVNVLFHLKTCLSIKTERTVYNISK